jgi:hypothetical protein
MFQVVRLVSQVVVCSVVGCGSCVVVCFSSICSDGYGIDVEAYTETIKSIKSCMFALCGVVWFQITTLLYFDSVRECI